MGILFLLGVYAYRKKEEAQARTFVFLMAALLVWTICYTLGLSSQELVGKIFWLRLKYLGSASAPIIWLIFSLQFTQNEGVLTRRVKTFVWGFYLISLGIVFTSDWQTWMWGSVWISPGMLEEQVTHGWYFWIYVLSSYIFILVSAWLYIRFLWIVPSIHQKQALLMALGGIIPLLGRIALDVFGLDIIPQLDEVILFFLASALIFSVAMFRYNVLSIMPVAYIEVFQSMQIGVIVLDPQKQVIELNPAVKNMIGVMSSGFQGKPLKTFWPQTDQLKLESEFVTELAVMAGDEERHFQLSNTFIRNRRGQFSGYLILVTDITQQKKGAFALEALAKEDGLTGLLNRRTFMDLAEVEHLRALRYRHSYAVIMLDLDHFKQINDTYGHQCGDKVIQEVAHRCKTILRSTDLVGRYGGEEFIVLIPETEDLAAILTAEKIWQVVSDMPIQLENATKPLTVTASVGVAVFTPNKEEGNPDLETMLSRVDEMLYASKKGGRNRIMIWHE